jgi:putative DNA primase/helicase
LDDFLIAEDGLKKWEALRPERWYGPTVPHLTVRTRTEFLKHKYSERENVMTSAAGTFLRHPIIAEIHAYRGVGKSHLAFYLAGALARQGGEFFRWKSTRALRVLYVEGEQPGADVQEQVKLQTRETPNLQIMSLEDQENFCFPKIVTPEGQRAFERVIEEKETEVLFLDSLSTLANIAMNDEENQLVLGDWFVRLRTGLGVTVFYLQHDGKGMQQRGHSKHEDWIDLSIHLTWTGDYQGAEGLRAHFHIDKARRPIADGQDMRITFGPRLTDPGKSDWTWKTATKKEEEKDAAFGTAYGILFIDPEISQRTVLAQMKKEGVKGRNQVLNKIIEQARAKVLKDRGIVPQPQNAKPPKF